MSSLFDRSALRRLDHPLGPPVEHVQRADSLRRLLAFAGKSIDDVVNCPFARRRVITYFRIGRQMTRLLEVDALERQWNPLGRQ